MQLLEWRVSEGLLEGFAADTLEHRATVTRSTDGRWLVTIHGTALNDEGNPYGWSRQQLDEAGEAVLCGSVADARARAEQLAVAFVAEHAANEQARLDSPPPPSDTPMGPAGA